MEQLYRGLRLAADGSVLLVGADNKQPASLSGAKAAATCVIQSKRLFYGHYEQAFGIRPHDR